MSDSVWPHRRQPTRLPRPWDSPGKNTGVGCHFLLQCMKVKSESEVTHLCPTPSDPMDWSLPGSSVHGIFQARVLDWGAIALSVLKCWIHVNIYTLKIDTGKRYPFSKENSFESRFNIKPYFQYSFIMLTYFVVEKKRQKYNETQQQLSYAQTCIKHNSETKTIIMHAFTLKQKWNIYKVEFFLGIESNFRNKLKTLNHFKFNIVQLDITPSSFQNKLFTAAS